MMQIYFGAIQHLGTHPHKTDLTTKYIDLQFDGPDIGVYQKLLGHNVVTEKTNDVMRLTYSNQFRLYGVTTHSTPHLSKASTLVRQAAQNVIEVADSYDRVAEVLSSTLPEAAATFKEDATKLRGVVRQAEPISLEPFAYQKQLHSFGLGERGVRTIFQKLLRRLNKDKVLEQPLIQGLQETFFAIKK